MTWLSWVPDTAWKGALLLAVAWIAARLLQKHAAALRHLVSPPALGGLLAMPVLSTATPVRLALPVGSIVAPANRDAPAAEPNRDAEAPAHQRNDKQTKTTLLVNN